MDYRHHPELIERLAAEYALGTLRGGARRRFTAWMAGDAALRVLVREWEQHLQPMTAAIAAVEPPPRVWEAVAAATAPSAAVAPGRLSLWENLAFWRGFGLAASGVAAAMAVFVGVRPPQIVERVQVVERVVEKPMRVSDGANPWQPSYVAALKDGNGKTMLMLYVGRNSNEVWMKYEGENMPRDASLELWGLDAEGHPKSLGLIRSSGSAVMKLPDIAERSVASFKKLAVSMEPMGGSTTGAPTGPVMYQGECQNFW
jgi:anti-sigma-K factor RskA